MSEFDKQTECFQGSASSRKLMKKCVMKIKVELEENDAHIQMLLMAGKSL